MRNKKMLCQIIGGTIAVTLTFGAFAVRAEPKMPEEYIEYCEEIGEQYHICPQLLQAMIKVESCGQADVVSATGCVGLLQVSPKWHKDRMVKLGVTDLYDPYSNILVAADYLAELFEEYEDLPMVLMTYNGSSDAWARWQSGDFTDYATEIMDYAWELERSNLNE